MCIFESFLEQSCEPGRVPGCSGAAPLGVTRMPLICLQGPGPTQISLFAYLQATHIYQIHQIYQKVSSQEIECKHENLLFSNLRELLILGKPSL